MTRLANQFNDAVLNRKAAALARTDDLVSRAELITDLLPAIRRVTQANRSR